MDNRERFLRTSRFQSVDHPPLLPPGSPWPATRKRWEQEGLPPGVSLEEFFGLEPCPMQHVGIETVLYPPFEEKILQDTGEYLVKIDHHGVKVKNFRDESSMPEHLEYPVKGPESLSWLRERLDWDHPGRVKAGWLNSAEKARSDGKLLLCNGGMYFAFLNEEMGTEALMLAFCDHPEFILQVNELQCRLCENALLTVLPEFKLDFVGYHEDMAYKNGSLISPDMFREYMTPYYRRISSITGQYGVDLQLMDSDGDISELIPLWLDCGISMMTPLEVAAGMDVVKLRKQYGHDLAMMGGFDKRILAAGKQEIKAELERIRPVIEGGGYLPACDHAVPPDVSFENYSCLVEGLKNIYGIGA